MPSEKADHILNTSSNLLGFCLVVLTSLKISNYSSRSRIDELTGVACMFFISSSMLSFLSIRTEDEQLSMKFERYADKIFMTALVFVFVITFLIAFSIIF
jgi:hypothetical protein